MKNQIKIYSSKMYRCTTILFMLIISYTSAQTNNNQDCWTAVGVTGIVDQNSRDVIKFGPKKGEVLAPISGGSGLALSQIRDNAGVAYLATASKGTYHIRYAINQRFIFGGFNAINLQARYKVSNKEKERVIVNLNKYNLESPSNPEKIETILTLDSDLFSENLKFQTQSILKNNVKFDFRNYGYYIDVQLITKSTGSPSDFISQPVRGVGTAIGLIQICSTITIDD